MRESRWINSATGEQYTFSHNINHDVYLSTLGEVSRVSALNSGWLRVGVSEDVVVVEGRKSKDAIDTIIELASQAPPRATLLVEWVNQHGERVKAITVSRESVMSDSSILESKSHSFAGLIEGLHLKATPDHQAEAERLLQLYFKRYADADEIANMVSRWSYELKGVRDGWSETIYTFLIATRYPPRSSVHGQDGVDQRPGMVYRGMSFEEWKVSLASNQIQSRGSYNFSNQKALTLYSNHAGTAEIYASGFAPVAYKPSIRRPGVVIEIESEGLLEPDRDSPNGLSSGERAHRGAIPLSRVRRAWWVTPTEVSPGTLDIIIDKYTGKVSEGSRSNPSARVVFVPITLPHLQESIHTFSQIIQEAIKLPRTPLPGGWAIEQKRGTDHWEFDASPEGESFGEHIHNYDLINPQGEATHRLGIIFYGDTASLQLWPIDLPMSRLVSRPEGGPGPSVLKALYPVLRAQHPEVKRINWMRGGSSIKANRLGRAYRVDRTFEALIESFYLTEATFEQTWKQWGPKILEIWKRTEDRNFTDRYTDITADSEVVFDEKSFKEDLLSMDPTPNKQYIPWICKTFVKNASTFTESWNYLIGEYTVPHVWYSSPGVVDHTASGVNVVLKAYDEAKKKGLIPDEYKDINNVPNFGALTRIVSENKDRVTQKEMDRRAKAGGKKVYEDSHWLVIQPTNVESACMYGKGTQWCTNSYDKDTGMYNTQFNYYTSTDHRGGKLFIFIPKSPSHTGEKYQMAVEGHAIQELKDETDEDISPRRIDGQRMGGFITALDHVVPDWDYEGDDYHEDDEPEEDDEPTILDLAFALDNAYRSDPQRWRERLGVMRRPPFSVDFVQHLLDQGAISYGDFNL